MLATLGAEAMQLGRRIADFDYPAALVSVRELMRKELEGCEAKQSSEANEPCFDFDHACIPSKRLNAVDGDSHEH